MRKKDHLSDFKRVMVDGDGDGVIWVIQKLLTNYWDLGFSEYDPKKSK